MSLTEARREYETIYVLRPQTGRPGSEKIAKRVNEVIGAGEGTLTYVESWGRRRLAYSVQKQRYGVYYYLKYHGTGALVSELERSLRLSDDVMKFQTVKVSDLGQAGSDVNPENLQFDHQDPVEEDPSESLAARLGLDDTRLGRDSGRPPPLDGEDEDEEGGIGDREGDGQAESTS